MELTQRNKQLMESRFWGKVDKMGNCWEWKGSRDNAGYGHACIPGSKRPHMAHRIAYVLAYGSVPDEMNVCHHCDNPGCVRPEHLFLGTAKDNVQDMMRKNRNKCGHLFGESHGRSKLTRQTVLEIRQKYIPWKVSCYSLAREYNVSPATVCAVVTNKYWNDVATS